MSWCDFSSEFYSESATKIELFKFSDRLLVNKKYTWIVHGALAKKRKGIALEETCEYKTESITYVAERFKVFGNFDIKVGFLNFTCGTIKDKLWLYREGSQKMN